jgi:tripartite-type tricarboxylate transporter receptor subunit TctC
VSGQIDLMFDALDAMALVRAGSTTAYAVVGGRRSVAAAEVPTFNELGLPGVSYSTWYGLFAPAGTPKEIIGRLNAAAVEALADPAVRSQLVDLRLEIFPREEQTPETLGALVRAGVDKWWPIIREFGIKAE